LIIVQKRTDPGSNYNHIAKGINATLALFQLAPDALGLALKRRQVERERVLGIVSS
jgi:hypothetical protein